MGGGVGKKRDLKTGDHRRGYGLKCGAKVTELSQGSTCIYLGAKMLSYITILNLSERFLKDLSINLFE